MTPTVRKYLNISPELDGRLRDYMTRNDIDASDAMRRAIRLMVDLDEAQARGASIRIVEDGKARDVMILA